MENVLTSDHASEYQEIYPYSATNIDSVKINTGNDERMHLASCVARLLEKWSWRRGEGGFVLGFRF